MESIGAQAFLGCAGMTGVLKLPVVEIIDGGTFACSASLSSNESLDDGPKFTSLILPEGLKTIYGNAFAGCTAMRGSLTIPNSVETIGFGAFKNCGFDGQLKLGDGLTKIQSGAFLGCHFTGGLTIPDSVTEIGDYAFGQAETDFSSYPPVITIVPGQFTGALKLGSGLTIVGEEAFAGCGFTSSIAIPDSISEIGAFAFAGMTSLNGALNMGNGVQYIGEYAFYRSSITGSLTIPDSVTVLGYGAFAECTGLNGTLTIESGVWNTATSFIEFDDSFKGCSRLRGLIVEEGNVEIPGGAFEDCTSLNHVELPSSLTQIHPYAFRNCSGLRTISFPEEFELIGSEAFSGCVSMEGILNISHLREHSLGHKEFEDCSSLRGVIVGSKTFANLLHNDQPFLGVSSYFTIYCPYGSETAYAAAQAGIPYSLTTMGNTYTCLPYGEIEMGESFRFCGLLETVNLILNLRVMLKDANGNTLQSATIPVNSCMARFSLIGEQIHIEELAEGQYTLIIEAETEDNPGTFWLCANTKFMIVALRQRVWTDQLNDLPFGLIIKGRNYETTATLYANRIIQSIRICVGKEKVNQWDVDTVINPMVRQISMTDVIREMHISELEVGKYEMRLEVSLSDEQVYTRSSHFTVFEFDGNMDEDLAVDIVLWCQNPQNRTVFAEDDHANYLSKLNDIDMLAMVICNYSDIIRDRIITVLKGQHGEGQLIRLYKESIYEMMKSMSYQELEYEDFWPFGDYVKENLKDYTSTNKFTMKEIESAYNSYSIYLQDKYNIKKPQADAVTKQIFKKELEYIKELKDYTSSLGKAMKVVSFGKDMFEVFQKAQLNYHQGMVALLTLRDAYGDQPSEEYLTALTEVINEYSSKEMIYLTESVDKLMEFCVEHTNEFVIEGVLELVEIGSPEFYSTIGLTYGLVKFAIDEGVAPVFQNTSDRDYDLLTAGNMLISNRDAYVRAFNAVLDGNASSEYLMKVYVAFQAAKFSIDKTYDAMIAIAEGKYDEEEATRLKNAQKIYKQLKIH